MHRASAFVFLAPFLVPAVPLAAADAPAPSDLELITRTRAAIGEVRAFERLNEEIIKRCHDPVTGAYADWRDEFHADLERTRALEKALQRRVPETKAEPPPDERLKPFTDVEGQPLFSRCLRWSTLLIQHESPVRGGIAAKFTLLHENEDRIRAIIANDAEWKEWRSAGTAP